MDNGAQNNSGLYGRIRSSRQAQTRPVNARRFSGDVVTSRPQVVLNIPASALPTSIDQPRPVQQIRSAVVPQQQVAPPALAPVPMPAPAPAPPQPQAQPEPQYQPQPEPQPQVPPVTVFAPPVEQPPAPPPVQYQPAPPAPAPPQPVAAPTPVQPPAPVPVQNPTPAPVAAAPVEAVLYNPIPQVPEMELVPEPVQVPTQAQYPVQVVPETSFAQPISQEPVIEQDVSMQYEYGDQYGAEDEADPAVKPVVWEKPVKNPELKMKLNRALTLGLMMAQTAFQAPVDAGKEVYRKLRGGEYSSSQVALTSMALLVFMIGVITSIQTIRTNHATSAQVAALVSQSNSKENVNTTVTNADGTKTSTSVAAVVPDPSLPNAQAISDYTVNPSEPRFIKIPSLGVNARVRQVGMLSNGELGTPKNAHDAAWYGASAKPGQPGATLIDGYASNATARGVFYDIKNMAPGDAINVERGDGGTVMYKVVKVQTYDADKVDMQAAVSPVSDGKSGLNLITCAGGVKPGTNELDKRVIIFAEQK